MVISWTHLTCTVSLIFPCREINTFKKLPMKDSWQNMIITCFKNASLMLSLPWMFQYSQALPQKLKEVIFELIEVIIFAGNWTSCESYLFEIYWGKFILYFGELFLAKRISATQTKVQVNYYTLSQKTHMHGIQWWPWKRRCPDSRYLAAPRHRWSHRRPGKLSILFWAESVRGQKHSNESKTLDKPKIRKH